MTENYSCGNIHELEEYCSSSSISLDVLQEKIESIPSTSLSCSSFLHKLVNNENITLDMVQLVLQINPYASYFCCNKFSGISYEDEDVRRYEAVNGEEMSSTSLKAKKKKCSDRAYPIHIAASNERCPNSIVELLSKSNPSALKHLCILENRTCNVDGHEVAQGTPLHYYLSRKKNMSVDTVKIILNECPDSLRTVDFFDSCQWWPIHAIIINPAVGMHNDIVKCMIDSDPSILQDMDKRFRTPLHLACLNKHITMNIVELLVDEFPTAAGMGQNGAIPVHYLCENTELEDKVKLDILCILVEAYPKGLRMRNAEFLLPMHIAAKCQGPSFCKVLVEGYPESLRLGNEDDALPFHLSCQFGSIETVKYLFESDRECINCMTRSGFYPIHQAVFKLERNDDDFDDEDDNKQLEIVKFLLQSDPECASKAMPLEIQGGSSFAGCLPLHIACVSRADMRTVRLLFDANPAAIYVKTNGGPFSRGGDPLHFARTVNMDAYNFLKKQLFDISFFEDTESDFPLHDALRNNITLGVFKLLLEKYPSGPDVDGNYPLHVVCEEGNCCVVNYLLKESTVAVSAKNIDNKLPFELLLKSDCDHNTLEYIEAIWRLLVAFPQTIFDLS